MAKIKVGELRDTIKLMDIKSEKAINFNGLEISIKQYLPIAEKLTLIKSIFESAIDRENGLHILNGNSLDIAFRVLLVEKYTNLNLPQRKDDDGNLATDIIQSYNMLVSSGLYDTIYENIPVTELSDINMALNNHIDAERDEYDQKNTIQYIIKDGLNKLIEKTPNETQLKELIANAKEEFSNLDIDKMNFLKAAIDWNNGVEK